MQPQSKRATAGTVTLSMDALAGAPTSNPSMEMTMTHNTTTPALGAITLASGKVVTPDHVLRLQEGGTPLRPNEPMKFNTWLDGQPVVTRHHVPIYASCRVLAAWGKRGLAAFVRPNGTIALVVDIAEGAKLTVAETDSGPTIRKYAPFPSGSVANGRNAAAGTEVGEDA